MYRFFKPLLFLFPPEFIHHAVAGAIKLYGFLGLSRLARANFRVEHPSLIRNILGLKFPNPIGLAAGFDKNASLFSHFFDFGFGFIEVGTLTPLAQEGNPKPRLFRLPLDGALINRLGFNNGGVKLAAERLKRYRKNGMIIGGNIGRNKNTPNEKAVDDYTACFKTLFPYVDYFTVNVSSPNTPGLRDLQDREPLLKLIAALHALNLQNQQPKPVLLKIAPDLRNEQLDDIIQIVRSTGIAGLVACNSTLSREGLRSAPSLVAETGGLSGRPLAKRSTEIVAYLRSRLPKNTVIIGVGGIDSPGEAIAKLNAGADLLQLYTGFVYEGPAVIRSLNKALIAASESLQH